MVTSLFAILPLGEAQFGRRSGLADFATNDLLRHARASTSFEDKKEGPEVEARQLPPPPRRQVLKQRALKPVRNQRMRLPQNQNGSGRNVAGDVSNLVQGRTWPQKSLNKKGVGVHHRYVGHFPRRRHSGNINLQSKNRFGPSDGFAWPTNNFNNFNINEHDSSNRRRFGLDETLGYFSTALRLLSYLVRNMTEEE